MAGGELRRQSMNKLIEAAQTIKDACNPANCNDCPLTDEAGRCVVKDWIDDMCPCEWRVEEAKDERND
jgi:hypothetical protein